MSQKFFLIAIIAVLFIAGCMRVRTYTVEKPRIDTEISGNRGYLSGSPSSEPKANKFGKTRKVSIIEIELIPKNERGEQVIQEKQESQTEIVDIDEEPLWVEEPLASMEEEDVAYVEEIDFSKDNYDVEYYTILKNDTLQKISYKFYGTTKKWKMLYEANDDVLKSPDKVYPGIKIVIP